MSDEIMMVAGFGVAGGVLLHMVFLWSLRNLGTCRRCRNKRRDCFCLGGPR